MPTQVTEKGAVQKPLLRYATEAGWSYLAPEKALDLRRGETSPILYETLVAQLQRLNPGVVDPGRAEEVARRLTVVPPTIEGNLDAWEFLKGLKTVFVPEDKRERNVRLLDLERIEANTFHVTDEFAFTNGIYRIRPDVVFLVNGVPIIIVETKAATHIEGIAEALDRIRRYHREGPELVALLQLHALTHLVQFYYGGTWTLGRKDLFNWRDEVAKGDFETLVKTFVEPHRVLCVLSDYVLFTRKDGELGKAVLRPHQMRAVERVVKRADDPAKRRGLIWHTQGSGKTYTMLTVAKRLIEDGRFQNPTVLMLVDRNELEQQLFGNLEALGFGNVAVARSKAHLQQLLASDQRGLIVSMIHKFDGIPANLNLRDNVFVLVDEAHRSTGGDLGNYLMGALPNATYLGFTGTPIDRTAHGQGTFKVFGQDDLKGYLDKYSIRESIADGTTLPLHYAIAPNEMQVDRETLEKEFLGLAELEGVADPDELDRVLDRAVTLKNMLKNRDRVERIASFIARHYRANVEPMGYKAFLVAPDREGCALYKEALDRYLPPEYSTVVISAGHGDLPHLVKYHLTDDAEETVRKAFRKPDALPKILIVTEKLLTGFDAPILYAMYLDKPMRDHVLLQAIARVNRPYEDDQGRRKPAGFVLDFVGIFDNLEKALAFDSEDVQAVVEGLDVLQRRFETLMAEGRSTYLTLWAGLFGDKAIEAVLEHFRDQEPRHAFYQFFRELQELYEILSPAAELRPFVEDYDALTRMYQLVRAAYEPNISVDKSFLRKTAELVRAHTDIGLFQPPTRIYKLDVDLIERLAGQTTSDTVKVFNLLRAINAIVQDLSAQAPYLLSIGDRAEAIAKAFEERQATTRDILKELEALLDEVKQAEATRQQMSLTPEGFAIFWLLRRSRIANAEDPAREAAEAIAQNPHWQHSESQERAVRVALYKVLMAAKVVKPVEFVDGIFTMLRRVAR